MLSLDGLDGLSQAHLAGGLVAGSIKEIDATLICHVHQACSRLVGLHILQAVCPQGNTAYQKVRAS